MLAEEATRLERGLLPVPLLGDESLGVGTGYRPGRERTLLGGDFYDAVELADGTLHVMIGDVCGHGPDEAALGACLRVAWRTLTLAERPPEETLAVLQDMLGHERHAPDIFATLALMTASPDREEGRLFLAGHPPPVLVDRDGLRLLDVERVCPPLGFVEPSSWIGNSVRFNGDWGLLLYTDGLVEGRVGSGSERLGPERLVELLAQRGARDVASLVDGSPLLDDLVAEIERLHGGDLTDDLAMVLVAARRGAG